MKSAAVAKDFTHESRLEDDHYSTVWAVWCDMTTH